MIFDLQGQPYSTVDATIKTTHDDYGPEIFGVDDGMVAFCILCINMVIILNIVRAVIYLDVIEVSVAMDSLQSIMDAGK